MKYTTIKITPMGEHDPKYGTRYWGTVQEADLPVSFNLLNPVNVDEGAVLEYEERSERESKKGTMYVQLKKVKVLGGQAKVEQEKASQTSIMGYARLIYTEQRKQTALLEKLAGVAYEPSDAPKEDKVVELTDGEVLGDEAIDLDQIPF